MLNLRGLDSLMHRYSWDLGTQDLEVLKCKNYFTIFVMHKQVRIVKTRISSFGLFPCNDFLSDLHIEYISH